MCRARSGGKSPSAPDFYLWWLREARSVRASSAEREASHPRAAGARRASLLWTMRALMRLLGDEEVEMVRFCIRAFAVGGAFAVLAQVVCDAYRALGCTGADAVSFMMMTLGVAGALAAGRPAYRALERAGGMGAAMPISGLASLVADRVADAVARTGQPGRDAAAGVGQPEGGSAMQADASRAGVAAAICRGVGSVIVNFAPGCALAVVLSLLV